MNNLKRLKKLVLANKETRRLYRMMQFLAIFMVISCTIIVVIAKWIEHDQNQKREELFGSWDEVFLDVPTEDLNYFKQNAFLEQISIQSIQEKVFLEGDKRVVIGSCDDNFLEMGNIELLEGRMPEKENEVAVEEEYLEILGVSGIGDVVSKDSIIETLIGYKVVGKVEDYSKTWKLINQDVKFINCFILRNESKLLNNNNLIYVNYKNPSNTDIEVNTINYRKNITNNNTVFSNAISGCFVFSFIVISLVIMLIFEIKTKLRKKLFESKKISYIPLIICIFIVVIIGVFYKCFEMICILLPFSFLNKKDALLIMIKVILSISIINMIGLTYLNYSINQVVIEDNYVVDEKVDISNILSNSDKIIYMNVSNEGIRFRSYFFEYKKDLAVQFEIFYHFIITVLFSLLACLLMIFAISKILKDTINNNKDYVINMRYFFNNTREELRFRIHFIRFIIVDFAVLLDVYFKYPISIDINLYNKIVLVYIAYMTLQFPILIFVNQLISEKIRREINLIAEL